MSLAGAGPARAMLLAAEMLKGDEAHGLGLKVLAWTVNSIDDMERLIALGRVERKLVDSELRLASIIGTTRAAAPILAPNRPNVRSARCTATPSTPSWFIAMRFRTETDPAAGSAPS